MALIITIIVLVILAAVSINAAFNTGIIDTAINGTVNYAEAQRQEQVTFDELDGSLQDVIKRIESYNIGGESNPTRTPNLPEVGEVPPEEGWTVEEAKEIVARDGLKAHLGEKVAYNPTGGGTWRIFYYDNEDQGNGEGYFGDDVGTVYLKRDCGSDMISLQEYNSYSPTDGGTVMKQMNPKWAKSSMNEIDTDSEHSVAWLCDPAKWTNYKVEGVAKYAIGTPSLEMFAKSYNIYGGSGAEIVTKIVDGTLHFHGYRPGLNGKFADDHLEDFRDGSLEAGPEGVFITPGVPGHWLSSMTRQSEVLTVNGISYRFGSNYSNMEECKAGVSPVVALL